MLVRKGALDGAPLSCVYSPMSTLLGVDDDSTICAAVLGADADR